MMIDALRILSIAGLHVADYRYTGFGSVHFVDFVMFHKLLGVDKMTSVEYDREIERRVLFNRPFNCIDVVIKPIGEVIPTLSHDERHVLWLDYDNVVSTSVLQDVWNAAAQLSTGSILIVTVDVEPPRKTEEPRAWKAYFEGVAGDYVGTRPLREYARSKLPSINCDILDRAMSSGVAGRPGVQVIPIFNFLYRDGHEMATMGCVVGTERDRRAVGGSGLDRRVYYRKSFAERPYDIHIPVVTRKERAYLDKMMPCDDDWIPVEFELGPQDVKLYREVYRFLPAYAELLL